MTIAKNPQNIQSDTESVVQIKLFGPLQIENNYGIVEENVIRPGVSWLLLKYILVNLGRDVTEEELGKLWSDKPGTQDDAAANRVRLRRLREALAPLHLDNKFGGLVLYGAGRYRINRFYELQLDVDVYDGLLERIARLPAEEPEGLRLCAEALELQRGGYLEFTSDADWLRPYQEHYRKTFVVLAEETLRRMQALGDDSAVSLLCRRAADLVPENADLHRRILGFLMENKKELLILRYISQLSRVDGKGPEWLQSCEA